MNGKNSQFFFGVITVLLMLSLAGLCVAKYGAEKEAENISASETPAVSAEAFVNAKPETVNEYDYDADDLEKREKAGITEALIAEQYLKHEDKYAFGQLDENLKNLYLEIFQIMSNMETEVAVSSVKQEEVERAIDFVLGDHPEIFYISGNSCKTYSYDGVIKKIEIIPSYTMSKEEVSEKKNEIRAYEEECFKDMPSGSDEYEKVKYLYEYIAKNTTYSVTARENQNILSVFCYGESVCMGYAKAMQYLLERQGIYAALVRGSVESGQPHAWDLVRVNDEYYYVDVTWGSAYYVFNGDNPENVSNKPDINYDYLCITTDDITATHTIDGAVEMPECTARKDNYYVRDGAYFTEYGETLMRAFFDKCKSEGRTFAAMKFERAALFSKAKEELIDKQKIFDYINAEGNFVSYADNQKQNTITFWTDTGQQD